MKSVAYLEHAFELDLIPTLRTLSIDAPPLWGGMNAPQVVEHLNMALGLSSGKYQVPLTTPEDKVEKLKKISLHSERPLPRDFTNPVLPKIPEPDPSKSMQERVDELQQTYELFKEVHETKPGEALYMHNLFGPLTYHEWLWFHYKHFCHHMAQFNLMPYVERFSLD